MSTLGEHTENENPTVTSLKRGDSKEQIDGLLQQFDVLPSGFDRFLFQYIYVFLIVTYLLGELLFIPYIFFLAIRSQFQVGEFLLESGLDVFPVVVIITVVWSFNIWRGRTPKSLHDFIVKKRIYVPDGDTNSSYLRFLENYREALASPKRYFFSGFLMILVGIIYTYSSYLIFIRHLNFFVTLLFVVENLLGAFGSLVMAYCVGIVTWTMYVSGWYIRKLVRVFELNIQPFHTDKCGGLKSLGNFCFGLVSPILLGSGLLIGYIFTLLIGSGFDTTFLTLIVGLVLVLLLLYALPATIFAFILPLRDIHTKMVSEGEIDEETYIAHVEGSREEIQALLATKQVEAAKAVQEERALVETLYTPYPTWPFSFRSKIFSTVLGTSGSILIGVMTAALQDHFLPAIIRLLFQSS